MAYAHLPIDTESLEDWLATIDDRMKLTPAHLQEIGDRALYMIQDRTGRGVDYKGDAFDPYSTAYAKHRVRKGRKVANVDLLFEGHMRASATASADDGFALIHFTSASEAAKALWHNDGTKKDGTQVVPPRRWFDIDADGDEAQALAEMAADFYALRFDE